MKARILATLAILMALFALNGLGASPASADTTPETATSTTNVQTPPGNDHSKVEAAGFVCNHDTGVTIATIRMYNYTRYTTATVVFLRSNPDMVTYTENSIPPTGANGPPTYITGTITVPEGQTTESITYYVTWPTGRHDGGNGPTTITVPPCVKTVVPGFGGGIAGPNCGNTTFPFMLHTTDGNTSTHIEFRVGATVAYQLDAQPNTDYTITLPAPAAGKTATFHVWQDGHEVVEHGKFPFDITTPGGPKQCPVATTSTVGTTSTTQGPTPTSSKPSANKPDELAMTGSETIILAMIAFGSAALGLGFWRRYGLRPTV